MPRLQKNPKPRPDNGQRGWQTIKSMPAQTITVIGHLEVTITSTLKKASMLDSLIMIHAFQSI
jgi:hypothetical protein